MEGTIQLKKYRTMRRRYGEGVDVVGETNRIGSSVNDMLKWISGKERRSQYKGVQCKQNQKHKSNKTLHVIIKQYRWCVKKKRKICKRQLKKGCKAALTTYWQLKKGLLHHIYKWLLYLNILQIGGVHSKVSKKILFYPIKCTNLQRTTHIELLATNYRVISI